MEPEPAATFKDGTLEHKLLYKRLEPPTERVRRGNAHHAPKPRERWRSAISEVAKTLINDSQFPYSKIRKDEIRLLCIHPGTGMQPLKGSLFKRKLNEAYNGYEALSYCWGNPKVKNTHEILIRDLNATLPNFEGEMHKTSPEVKFRMAVRATFEVPFSIRQNLYQALMKLRSKIHEVNIWVDAICIDQSERGKSEKEEQLSQMAKIYNSASNVCIWLGDGFEGSVDGIQLVRDIMNFKTFDVLINTPEAKTRWSYLIEIMKAPWFSRRWIIQELAMARNASMHCADEVFHWDDFAEAVSLLIEKIDVIRDKFRDEVFEDVETSSACILVHTLSNVCRKSDDGTVLAKLSDLETLVSKLLGFQATFPRDTIYSILSLAQDPPQANEAWEKLHSDQLKRNHQNYELVRGKKPGLNTQHAGIAQNRGISLTANYKLSTRDLFIAFVTRCIERSECLDIICRHWAPPVRDKRFGEEVQMPSWISGISKTSFDIPGTSRGRQNGENFVAYSPYDQRKRYRASGPYKARFQMVIDPSLDPPEIAQSLGNHKNINIMDGPLTQSPVPSPTQEKFPKESDTIPEELEVPITKGAPRTRPGASEAAELKAKAASGMNRPVTLSNESSAAPPTIHVTSHTLPNQSLGPNNKRKFDAQSGSTTYSAVARQRKPSRKLTRAPDVELEHELSGILAVEGFVLGTITTHSDVMRGGIIPGEWVSRMGWNKEQVENRVPDTLWRLLVADRTPSGGKPPQWYKRACLHGLMDPRVADTEGNLHSVTPVDRKISELTTKYFSRVSTVVWNRRLFEAEATHGFQGPLFGLSPKKSEVGSIICILLGCTVPVVLRKVKEPLVDNQYELVGEAYVHGMMDGEAVENKGLVDGLLQEFTLS